jgi:hypothetical protein
MRLHLACAPDGTPRAAILAPADQKEREVALRLLPIALRGGEALVCDKGYAGSEFEQAVAERFGARVLRPSRADEPDNGLHLSSIRQLVESVFWTLKDRLGLERHRARTLAGIRARVASKLLALAAGVWLNHLLGRPTRAFAELADLTRAWNQPSRVSFMRGRLTARAGTSAGPPSPEAQAASR